MFDVITIGSAIKDVFLLSDKFTFIRSKAFETGIGECVSLGSKIELDAVVHTTGGGATNAAVTFANLGFKTAAVCRVGKDPEGTTVLEELQKKGIDISMVVKVDKGVTGYSTLMTADTGERTALVYRGVSGSFQTRDMPFGACRTHWFYVTSLGGNLDLLKKLIRYAGQCRSHIAWNPGRAEIERNPILVSALAKQVAVFMVNTEEGAELTGHKDVLDMLEPLSSRKNVVIVTDGERGSYAFSEDQTYRAETGRVKSVSQTGAGDAFGSGFVAAFIKTGDIKISLATGTANAEGVIQKIGAKAGILKAWPKPQALKKIPVRLLKT